MKNMWIKTIELVSMILCTTSFSEVDTTICVLIQDSAPYRICARVQGKSKLDKLSVCFYATEHTGEKCIYKDTILDAIGEEGYWDSMTMHTNCHTQAECRWYFITTEGGMIKPKPAKYPLASNKVYFHEFKKQLKVFLSSKLKLNKQDVEDKVNKIIMDIDSDKKKLFLLMTDPVFPSKGPFIWIDETQSFFIYKGND
jgi:hypothetical protein